MASSYPKILHYGLQAAYDAIETKDANKLYFCTDTKKIYKGDIDFSESAVAAASKDSLTVIATDRLYLFADTGSAEFYDGTNWHVVSYKTVTSFNDATADDASVATTEAIKEYVASVIGGSSDVVKSLATGTNAGTIKYTTADGTVHDNVKVKDVLVAASAGANDAQIDLTDVDGDKTTVTIPGVVTDVVASTAASNAAKIQVTDSAGNAADFTVPGVFTGLAAKTGVNNEAKVTVTPSTGSAFDVEVPGVFTDVDWNSTSRVLSFTVSGSANASTVDLGKDIFIDSAAPNRYENGNIYLYLNDGTTTAEDTEIVIPVTGLIVDYFGDDTDSIAVDVDSTTHKVTAEAILRPTTSTFTNALQVSSAAGDKGLYVDLSDVEESIDALATAITWGTF